MGAAPEIVATAKPSRTRRQPFGRPATPAPQQSRRDQVAQKRTQEIARAAYEKAYRKAQILIAQRQATEAAMKDAGVQQQQVQPRPQGQKQAKTPPRSPVAKNQRAVRRKPASRR